MKQDKSVKEYKGLKQLASLLQAVGVLIVACGGLMTLIYMVADIPVTAILTFIAGVALSLPYFVIGGLVEVQIDNAQNSFVTAAQLTKLVTKRAEKKAKSIPAKPPVVRDVSPKTVAAIERMVERIEASK